MNGRARVPSRPPPPPLHHIRHREAASVGGGCGLTLAPSEASEETGTVRAGPLGPEKADASCTRSVSDSSGRLRLCLRGVGSFPSGFLMASTRRLRSCHVNLLDHGWIQHSTAGQTANVMFACKPDGSRLICYDQRGLNAIARPAVEPLPHIDALLDGTRECHRASSGAAAARRPPGLDAWRLPVHQFRPSGFNARSLSGAAAALREADWRKISSLAAHGPGPRRSRAASAPS